LIRDAAQRRESSALSPCSFAPVAKSRLIIDGSSKKYL
jgi:hypothetical protein